MSNTVCSVCYRSNKAKLPPPPPVYIPSPLLQYASSSMRRGREGRPTFVSSVCNMIVGGGHQGFHLIELRDREAARFGEALVDSLIGAEGSEICLTVVTNQSNH